MNREKQSPMQMTKAMHVTSPEELALSTRDVFRFLSGRTRGERPALIRLGIVLALQALVVGGSIWLLKTAVDEYFTSHTTWLLIFALAMVTLGKSLLDFLFNWIQNLAVARVRDALVNEAYHQLLNSPFSFHIRERNSRKYGWILVDTNSFIESSFGLLQVWVKQPLQVVSSIAALVAINWQLTAIGMLAIPISLPALRYFRRKGGEFIAQRRMLLGQLEERIAETIYGIRMVKVFGLEAREERRVADIIQTQRDMHQTNAFYVGLTGPATEALGLFGLTLVLLLGTQSISTGSFTTGTFIAFLLAFFNIYRPLKDFSRGFTLHQMVLDAGRRLILLEQQAQANTAVQRSAHIDRFESLEYRGVSFSYTERDEAPYVLNDINLRIQRGELILLTGISGAGKSTLCDLMFRLFKPLHGELMVNGTPLEAIEPESHRRLFALCSQETIVFNETLFENIRIARPDAAREEVLKVAELAQFTDKMMQRIDDFIGDRGTQLSGGERQRLALARAILCRPQLLVLDEALNNLDADTESRVWKALREYLPECTMLVVSHRWLDLNQYDRLLVLADGRLIEDTKISNDSSASTLLEKYRQAAKLVTAARERRPRSA